MPRITGQDIDNTGSITDSLRTIGDSMFKPIDPVSAEKIRGMQRQSTARANMVAAIQRGDLVEAGAQGVLGDVPIADAIGYERQAGLIGPDWRPTQPLYVPSPQSPQSPQPPAPMAAGSNAAVPQFAPQTGGSSPWR
jgi:hypothetical protein